MLSVRLVSRNRLTITALIVIFTLAANEEINEDELGKITANNSGFSSLPSCFMNRRPIGEKSTSFSNGNNKKSFKIFLSGYLPSEVLLEVVLLVYHFHLEDLKKL